MANSAFTHDPQITVPGSSTDNAVVIFDGTAGTGFGNSTIVVDSGGNGRIGIAADTDVIIVTANTVTVAGAVTASGVVTGGTLAGTISTVTQNSITTMTGLTTVGALNAGSITNGFTSIDVGSGAITTTGAISGATIAGDMRASVAQTTTGTSTALAVTPDGLAGSVHGEKVIQMVVVDFATALTTGSKFYFHVPSTLNGFDIVDVHAEVITAGVGANLITIDLHNVRHAGGDVDILSTNITINASATGSDTATTAAVINSGAGYDALATNDVIRVDIDQIGNTTAGSGLIVTLICRLP